jgi:hypothetical protein
MWFRSSVTAMQTGLKERGDNNFDIVDKGFEK